MQNKANFRKVKLNVTKVLIKDYDQMDTWSIRKTKPIQSQLKPIQSQLKPIQSQLKPIQSQSKPIQTQFKPNLSCVASGEAGNKPNLSCRSLWRSRNKPNFKGKKMCLDAPKRLTITNMIDNFEKLYGVLVVYRKDSFWEVIKCKLISNLSF
jgi:hypothetical protein